MLAWQGRWRTLVAALALGAAVPCGADVAAHVVRVHDGDTLTVRIDGRQERVRLFGIDAPERAQPHGAAAREALVSRVAGREVRLVEHGRDGFGRLLAVVHLPLLDVNADMVRAGHAWAFQRSGGDARLLALENEARAARRGLWRDPRAQAPWRWRNRARERPPMRPARAPIEEAS